MRLALAGADPNSAGSNAGVDPVTGEDFSWKLSAAWRQSAELNAQQRRN
jgi:hypothetical protein